MDAQNPRLVDYIVSEYRYQDERAESIYTRVNWQISASVLLAGAAYAAYHDEWLRFWLKSGFSLAYVLSGCALMTLLIGVALINAIAIIPGRYAVPGPASKWLQFGIASDPTDAAGPSVDQRMITELAEIADENRNVNRRRFGWLNCSAKLLALSAFLLTIHLLAAGALHLRQFE